MHAQPELLDMSNDLGTVRGRDRRKGVAFLLLRQQVRVRCTRTAEGIRMDSAASA